jgi:hypothetical protein
MDVPVRPPVAVTIPLPPPCHLKQLLAKHPLPSAARHVGDAVAEHLVIYGFFYNNKKLFAGRIKAVMAVLRLWAQSASSAQKTYASRKAYWAVQGRCMLAGSAEHIRQPLTAYCVPESKTPKAAARRFLCSPNRPPPGRKSPKSQWAGRNSLPGGWRWWPWPTGWFDTGFFWVCALGGPRAGPGLRPCGFRRS